MLDRRLGPDVRARLWTRDQHALRVNGAGGHREAELSAILKGNIRYRMGALDASARAGDAVVVPAGAPHTTTFDGELHAVTLWLGPGTLAEGADAIGIRSTSLEAGVFSEGRARTIVELAGALGRELEAQERGHLVVAEALLDAIVIALLRGASSIHRERASSHANLHPKIRRALERIQCDFAGPLTASSLAEAEGMSRFAFSRLFREQVGIAPYRYLLDTRLERAAERLRSGRCSVSEVALDVGFVDLSRFAAMFRRRYGCSPRELAARGRDAGQGRARVGTRIA